MSDRRISQTLSGPQCQKIGKPNHSKILRCKKTKGPKQDSQNRPRSPMHGGVALDLAIITLLYWAHDTLGD